MANTYVKIASVTVGAGGASTIEFTSIPGTYDDLIIKCSMRGTYAGAVEGVNLELNGNAGSNYSHRYLQGDGASASSTTVTGDTKAQVALMSAANNTASTFGNGEIYLPNYIGSTNKSFSTDSVSENNATTAYGRLSAGIWAQTNAITSIKLSPSLGTTWAQYSTATLYGIKKS